jgi:hypothetical protein
MVCGLGPQSRLIFPHIKFYVVNRFKSVVKSLEISHLPLHFFSNKLLKKRRFIGKRLKTPFIKLVPKYLEYKNKHKYDAGSPRKKGSQDCG